MGGKVASALPLALPAPITRCMACFTHPSRSPVTLLMKAQLTRQVNSKCSLSKLEAVSLFQERINAFKSEAMVLCRDGVERPLQAGKD